MAKRTKRLAAVMHGMMRPENRQAPPGERRLEARSAPRNRAERRAAEKRAKC